MQRSLPFLKTYGRLLAVIPWLNQGDRVTSVTPSASGAGSSHSLCGYRLSAPRRVGDVVDGSEFSRTRDVHRSFDLA